MSQIHTARPASDPHAKLCILVLSVEAAAQRVCCCAGLTAGHTVLLGELTADDIGRSVYRSAMRWTSRRTRAWGAAITTIPAAR